MKRLSWDQVEKLNKKGSEVRDNRGRRYTGTKPVTNSVTNKPAPMPEPIVTTEDILDKFSDILRVNSENAGVLSEIVSKLSEPKPKRSFTSTFTRDKAGNIIEASIQEI